MSTKALIDRIYARIHRLPLKTEWTRHTGSLSILKLVEAAQDELLDEAKQSQIWIGNENGGFPPYLKTQNNINRYDIIPANLSNVAGITVQIAGSPVTVKAKNVLRVFVDSTHNCSDYGLSHMASSVPYHFQNPLMGNMTRLEIMQVPARGYESTEDGNASVEFLINPGSHSNKYFCEFTWEAPRLTSESVPLVIPGKFESALEEYAIGKVLENEQPTPNMYSQKFETYWKPKFSEHKNNSGAKPQATQVVRRFC